MVSEGFECPHCEVVASRRHNFIRHLTATHGLESAGAEQCANDQVQPAESIAPRSGRVFVTPGHLRSVSMLEDTVAATETISAFRNALGGVGILLRPVDAGLTAMSLDVERCSSMISVGAAGGGGALTSLPSSSERIDSMISAYEDKRDNLARGSLEERFSLRLIAAALHDGLRLPGASPWLVVAHEWRVHLSNESNGKIDLLGFDPVTRRLVVIELKASEADARKPDPNGWDAARQADEYADAIWQGRHELYPFFDRLIAAQVEMYAPGAVMPPIDTSSRPTSTVWWPDAAGDHTPTWPAWNSVELAVASDSPRMAKYRRHQSWWRETQRKTAPGAHPKVPGRLIGSVFNAASVETDRRLNFIDETAYRHAVQRSREVVGEGGTLDEDRLFTNLLSSMPMCFNLFGAVGTPRFADLVRTVFDDEATAVDDVVCEAPTPPTWKDRTAFDAQVDYTTRSGDRRFLAIETKYTEPFTRTHYDRAEYRDLTEQSGWFENGAADVLVDVETNQLWRGLLLMNVVDAHDGATGRYCVVAPGDDSEARAATEKVRSWLVPEERSRLRFVSLEEIVAAARNIKDPRLNKWSELLSETPQANQRSVSTTSVPFENSQRRDDVSPRTLNGETRSRSSAPCSAGSHPP